MEFRAIPSNPSYLCSFSQQVFQKQQEGLKETIHDSSYIRQTFASSRSTRHKQVPKKSDGKTDGGGGSYMRSVYAHEENTCPRLCEITKILHFTLCRSVLHQSFSLGIILAIPLFEHPSICRMHRILSPP